MEIKDRPVQIMSLHEGASPMVFIAARDAVQKKYAQMLAEYNGVFFGMRDPSLFDPNRYMSEAQIDASIYTPWSPGDSSRSREVNMRFEAPPGHNPRVLALAVGQIDFALKRFYSQAE